MKKILSLMILVIFLVGTISALNEETYNKMGFWSKLKYNFYTGNIFFFTSWGEANCCSTDPDKEKILKEGDRVDCDDYCSYDKCAIDVWYDKYIYLSGSPPYSASNPDWSRLVWYKEEAGDNEYFKAPSTHDYWFVQVYCCPKSCAVSDHSTKVYKCENGEWDYKGRYDVDEYCSHDTSGVHLCWCDDEDERYYIDESGSVHCRSSPHDSWCTEYIAHYTKKCVSSGGKEYLYWYDSRGARDDLIDTCSSEEQCTTSGCVKTCKSKGEVCIPGLGQCCSGLTCYGVCLGTEGECINEDTKCEGTTYYECENYKWVSMGEVAGKCGYSGVVSHYTKKCYNNDVYWYDSSGSKEDKYKECGTTGCLNGACISLLCSSGFDNNKDNVIDRDELGIAINKWVNDDISRSDLGEAIMEWANGC